MHYHCSHCRCASLYYLAFGWICWLQRCKRAWNRGGISWLRARWCLPSFLPLGGGHVSGVSLGAVLRVALPVVLGYGGAARCVLSTLVRAEHMVLLRSLECTLPFWPLPDTGLLPYVLPGLFLCVCPFCYQQLLLCYSSAGCNTQGHEIQRCASADVQTTACTTSDCLEATLPVQQSQAPGNLTVSFGVDETAFLPGLPFQHEELASGTGLLSHTASD